MRLCSFFLLLPMAILRAQAPPATLDGDVVDSVTSAPIASARVKLAGGKSEARYAAADARGHFHFDNVFRGSYTLSVEHPAYLPSDSIQVHTGKSAVKVPLTAGAILYGTVTDPNGLPAPPGGGFFLRIFQLRPVSSANSPGVQRLPDGKSELVEIPYRQFPDDRGQYRSGLLEPGLYYIAIVSQHAPDFWDRTWRSTYYPHAPDMESAKAIELSQGQQMRADIQVIRQAGIRVSGRVAVPSHDPPPPGMQIVTRVYLASHGGLLQNSSISSTVTADRFEAVDLLPGTYTVLAETLQMSTDVPARNAKVLFGTLRQVQIGERDISGLDLELQPLPEVTGRVTFADGCTAAPVGVDLQSMSVVAFTQHSAVIGPGGAFAFGTFAPGTLFISATGPGQASVFLGDRDITRSGFAYPTPAPQALRITMSCASGGAQ